MRPIGLLLTTVIPLVFAQSQELWVTRIGGPSTCEASAVAADRNGAVYAGGCWQGPGTSNTDMFLAKMNAATGDTLWTRFYRATNYDRVHDIALNDTGTVVAVGQSNNQYTVLHYGADGTFHTAWRDNLHPASGSYAIAVCTDETGAAYVTGNGNDLGSSINVYTMKFSPAGDSLWCFTYAPPDAQADIAYDIAVDENHNCVVAGTSGGSILTMKLNPSGDTVWTRKYHGPSPGSNTGFAVALDLEGNVFVAGETYLGGRLAACVISYSPAGALRFAEIHSNPAYQWDTFSDIAFDHNGYVIASGTAKVSTYLQATLVARYSSGGDSLWARAFRPTTADASLGSRVAVDSAGIAYVAAQSRTGDFDINAVGYHPNGTLIGAEEYSGAGSYDDASRDIALGVNGRVFVAGNVGLSSGSTDFAVICFDLSLTSVGTVNEYLPARPRLMQNYPNPFNPTTQILYEIPGAAGRSAGVRDVRLAVFDLLGREVAVLVDEGKAPGSYETEFNASALSSGVYLVRLTVGGFTLARKMLMAR